MKPPRNLRFDKSWINSIQSRFMDFPKSELPIFPPHVFTSKNQRTAAVFIPLCNKNNVASVLFTIRSSKVSTHKKEVSFPGGHIESNETDIEAAIRETYEELGSNIGPLQYLGSGQRIPAKTETLVTPIIGFLETDIMELSHFDPSKEEVDQIFSVPIETLLNPLFRKTEMLSRNAQSPTPIEFPYFGDHGDPQRIWGFTGKILDVVLRDLILPTVKRHDQ